MTDGFDVDLDLFKPHASIARPALHQEDAARRDTRQEGFGRRDLLTGPAQMRRLVDDELVIAHFVEGASQRRSAGRVNAVYDQFVSGHSSLTNPL